MFFIIMCLILLKTCKVVLNGSACCATRAAILVSAEKLVLRNQRFALHWECLPTYRPPALQIHFLPKQISISSSPLRRCRQTLFASKRTGNPSQKEMMAAAQLKHCGTSLPESLGIQKSRFYPMATAFE